MIPAATPDDLRSITIGALRLDFLRVGDRWTHALRIGEARPAMAVEGDPDRDPPSRVVSPTYQEVQFDETGGPVRAFLLGQSGPHHFSAVFAVEGRDEVLIDVDVADRCRFGVEALASTYRVDLPSSCLHEADPLRIAWDLADPSGRLAFEAIDPTRLAMAEAGLRGVQVQAESRIDPASHTHRCRYRWRWTPTIGPVADDG